MVSPCLPGYAPKSGHLQPPLGQILISLDFRYAVDIKQHSMIQKNWEFMIFGPCLPTFKSTHVLHGRRVSSAPQDCTRQLPSNFC